MRDPQLSRPNAWGGVYAYSHSKLCQVRHLQDCCQDCVRYAKRILVIMYTKLVWAFGMNLVGTARIGVYLSKLQSCCVTVYGASMSAK